MKTLGQRIRELRQEKDLSLRELAAKIGVSSAFMSDVELGRRNPSDRHMESIAHILETPLEELQRFDTRPPLREFQRAALSDPGYGVAFRQMMERNISSEELLQFIRERDRRRREGGY